MWYKKVGTISFCFMIIHAFVRRQTDGQTDGQNCLRNTVRCIMQSHGKNITVGRILIWLSVAIVSWVTAKYGVKCLNVYVSRINNCTLNTCMHVDFGVYYCYWLPPPRRLCNARRLYVCLSVCVCAVLLLSCETGCSVYLYVLYASKVERVS